MLSLFVTLRKAQDFPHPKAQRTGAIAPSQIVDD